MSTATTDDLRDYAFAKTDEPEIRARKRMIVEWALEASPETREKLVELVTELSIERGRLQEARRGLRHVLDLRQLALSTADEARVDGCTDLDTLRRWLDQAIVAASTADALR